MCEVEYEREVKNYTRGKWCGCDIVAYLFGIDIQFCNLAAVHSNKNMMPVSVEYVGFPDKHWSTDIIGTYICFLTMYEHKFVTWEKR